jgi:sulfatase maturation enzyme AslB (radical SAM superfamily)
MSFEFNWFESLASLQIEITTHCNARCPGCLRNIKGGERDTNFNLQHMDVELWRKLFEEDLKNKKILHVHLNGNLGDAGMHPDLIEMIRILNRSHPEVILTIATNGSMRKPSWWSELVDELKILNNHMVQVAIDGIGSNHSVYRKDVDFDKVCANVKAMTANGGKVEIITTLFDHNLHEIDEIALLSKELGCRRHTTRNSYLKYIADIDRVQGITSYNTPVLTKHKVVSWNNQNKKTFKPVVPVKSFADVECPWYKTNRIQIDAYGTVWPCCWMPSSSETVDIFDSSKSIMPHTNTDLYSLHKFSLEEILSSTWYTTILPNKIATKQYTVCNTKCTSSIQ